MYFNFVLSLLLASSLHLQAHASQSSCNVKVPRRQNDNTCREHERPYIRIVEWSDMTFDCSRLYRTTKNTTCYLINNGSILMEASKCAGDKRHLVLNLTDIGTGSYTVEQYGIDKCNIATLQITENPQDCQNSLHSGFQVTNIQKKYEDAGYISCFRGKDKNAGIPLSSMNLENSTYMVWRGCETSVTPATTMESFTDMKVKFAHLVTYTDAGLYTCMFNHSGKFLFASYNLTVCEPFKPEASLMCDDTRVFSSTGESAQFTCKAIRGTGHKTKSLIRLGDTAKLKLPNGTELKCTKEIKNNASISCLITDHGEDRCLTKPPKTPSQVYWLLNITVRTRNSIDFGDYVVIYQGHSGDEGSNVTVQVKPKPQRAFIIPLVTCILVVFCLLLLLYLAIFCFKSDMCWLWKKAFGSYEKANLKYGAYIAYYYHFDIEAGSKDVLRKLLGQVESHLLSLNYLLYDDHKHESTHQYELDRIQEMQDKCHRTIIVLTKEYITDYLSIHTTNVALQNLVENNKKVIFISFPETKKYLKKKMKDETAVTLLNSLKLNHNIMWDRRIPLTGRFKRHLEYAMPKVKDQRMKNEYKEVKGEELQVISTTISTEVR